MSTAHELEQASIDSIRHALLIGLASFGEISRILDHIKTMKSLGRDVPEELIPTHPTASPDTIGLFADAIRMVDL